VFSKVGYEPDARPHHHRHILRTPYPPLLLPPPPLRHSRRPRRPLAAVRRWGLVFVPKLSCRFLRARWNNLPEIALVGRASSTRGLVRDLRSAHKCQKRHSIYYYVFKISVKKRPHIICKRDLLSFAKETYYHLHTRSVTILGAILPLFPICLRWV
jgi:hypothetical protein